MQRTSAIRCRGLRFLLPRLLALLALVGGLSGCGSGSKDSPNAIAKFCNRLSSSAGDFTAYLSINGTGTSDQLTAHTGTCSPCTSIVAGEMLSFELGNETTGVWMERFNKILEIKGQYNFKAEIDSTGSPAAVAYRPLAGYTCETMGM